MTPRYRPPNNVHETTVADLLRGVRPTAKDDKNRTGVWNDPSHSLRVWYAGDNTLVKQPCVAIVGTRKVSADGAKRARHLARDLVSHGVVVVSGLAYGVDAAAMRAAIDANGKTIGVIGTPVDIASPMENASVQETIYEKHLLISQFQVGRPVSRGNFPRATS